MEKSQGKLFIVSGPSGVGKTTIVTKFLDMYQDVYNIHRVITYTTKKPRTIERDGIDYHFITQSEFENKVQADFFLEWSGDYGACYGTPAYIIDQLHEGKSQILVIDRNGAAQIVKKYPSVVLVWISISSFQLLSDRLEHRKTEDREQIQKRLFLARKEMEEELHDPLYTYSIMNDKIAESIEKLVNIVADHVNIVAKIDI